MKIYELRFEVPLPDGVFAEAETTAKLKGPVEACLRAWVGVKMPGMKVQNRVVVKRGDYGKRHRRGPPLLVPDGMSFCDAVEAAAAAKGIKR